MSLLELRHVHKRRSRGGRRVVVLEDASLSVDTGELVAVWGARASGRTTLLRVAAGIDAPDAGSVHFDGRDLAARGHEPLGSEIGYCQPAFRAVPGRPASEEVIVGLLVNGIAGAEARVCAREALERVGGERLGARAFCELDGGERVRLAIARALSLQPRLLLIDEPVSGVELHQRDGILLLARSLADEGIAVVMTVGEPTGLSGADRSLTIGDGELCASPKRELAPVLPLRARRDATAGSAGLRTSG
jgi:ABC-type lipoprotein export system ATPase subunit